jgi:hypothetical protein
MVGVSLTWLLHFMGECFATCPIIYSKVTGDFREITRHPHIA